MVRIHWLKIPAVNPLSIWLVPEGFEELAIQIESSGDKKPLRKATFSRRASDSNGLIKPLS